MADTYKEKKVIQFPNGTVTVYFPELTPEERERRLKRIGESAARVVYPELK